MTQFERIKHMDTEELAELLDDAVENPCKAICNNFDRCRRNNAPEPICRNHYREWLDSEVEEREG